MITPNERREAFNAKSTADEVLSGMDLTGKRFLITGISSGIGLETARALVSRGASVVGAVRNLDKAQSATAVIRDIAVISGGALRLIELDLSSLQSVRTCADKLLFESRPFDAIIANAGIMATPFARTVDGYENQFGTNYLGHFALITWLDKLLSENSRVILVSSQAHRVSDIDLSDLDYEYQEYDPFVAYGRSKTAICLFALEFDRRYRERGIRAASVMPGTSLTDLARHFSKAQLQGLFDTVSKNRADSGIPPMELKSIAQAAATSVWAAVVANEEVIGGQYLEDCTVAPVNNAANPFADGVMPYALDSVKARQLWLKSEQALLETV